eukprot:5282564-Amphidinium_carterae.1
MRWRCHRRSTRRPEWSSHRRREPMRKADSSGKRNQQIGAVRYLRTEHKRRRDRKEIMYFEDVGMHSLRWFLKWTEHRYALHMDPKFSSTRCELWLSCAAQSCKRERAGATAGTGPNSPRLLEISGVFSTYCPAPRPDWCAACHIDGRLRRIRAGVSFLGLCRTCDALLVQGQKRGRHSGAAASSGDPMDETHDCEADDGGVNLAVKLPAIVSWSARALFAASSDVARRKLQVLRQQLPLCDVLCVQETHAGRGGESAVLSDSWHRFSSIGSGRMGGIMMLVRQSWLATGQWRPSHVELVKGRAIAIRLTSDLTRGTLILLGLHVECTEELSASDVLKEVLAYACSFKSKKAIVLGCGELNFDLDDDRVSASGTILPRRGGHLARVWQGFCSDYTVPMIDSPAHLHGDGTLAKIDYHFTSMSAASVSALGGHCYVYGHHNSPPGGSDHWPICLVWRAGTCDSEEGLVPRWVQQDPYGNSSWNRWRPRCWIY